MRYPHYEYVCEASSGGCAAAEDLEAAEQQRILNVLEIFDEVLVPPLGMKLHTHIDV